MEQKQRLFIYDRKEMGVLLLLGVMVAIFAFTLGVHMGKAIPPKPGVEHAATGHGEGHEAVGTVADKTPNRQELNEQSKGAQQAADESLDQSLKEEVAKTGIKLDQPRQIQLPDKPRSENAGATTTAGNESHPAHITNDTAPMQAPAAHAPRAENHAAAPADQHEATTPAVAEPVTLPAAARRPSPAGKFTLQIGSFPAIDEARDQADSLEALGMKPFLRPAEVKGKRWYRLYVGGFENHEAAEKAGKRYVAQHMVEAFVVSKMVD
jgi:cell division protein FtsN